MIKHIEIPLPFTVIYFSDLIMVAYTVYVYSGNTLVPNPLLVPMINSALMYIILKTVAFALFVAFINFTKYYSEKQYKYSGYFVSGITILYTLATMNTVPMAHNIWVKSLIGDANITPEFYQYMQNTSELMKRPNFGNISIKI